MVVFVRILTVFKLPLNSLLDVFIVFLFDCTQNFFLPDFFCHRILAATRGLSAAAVTSFKLPVASGYPFFAALIFVLQGGGGPGEGGEQSPSKHVPAHSGGGGPVPPRQSYQVRGEDNILYLIYIKSKIVRIVKMQFFNTDLYKYGNERIKRRRKKYSAQIYYLYCYLLAFYSGALNKSVIYFLKFIFFCDFG